MKEIKDIIQSYQQATAAGKKTVLATVVHVDGSSYRRPGARMLITEDGEMTGAISGGCLEGDALRKALLVMIKQKTMLVTYDTSDEDDAKMGLGLGCNGIIQVLIEPVLHEADDNPVSFLQQVAATREAYCLVTLFSLEDKHAAQPGTCMLYAAGGIVSGTASFPGDTLIADAAAVLLARQSCFKKYILEDIEITAFIEWIEQPISLVVMGAGNDIFPLVNIAAVLGWETTIVDGRPNYAKPERFAGCSVIVSNPDKALEHIKIDDHTFFLLMTHNYNYDKAMLGNLLTRKIVYVGMLGPRKKLDRMLNELENAGNHYTAGQLSLIHSPVGLDIGAETPEAIALSILAEIQAVAAGRPANSLNTNPAPIHSRIATHIEEIKLV